MRKLLHATAALSASLVTSMAANAADVYARPRPSAPPPPVYAPPPVFNWSGCYIGGYVGGAWSERDAIFTDLGNSNFGAFSGGLVGGRREGSHSFNVGLDSSVIGGGTLGCNWQPYGSPFVFGIEGEGGYMKLEGSAFDPLLGPTLSIAAVGGTPDVLGRAKIGDWYAMATGRLGYAWDRFMIYAKGGAAFVPVSASVADSCLNVATGCGNWIISTAVSDTVTTWTVGGGAEWAIWSNWSLKAEYMFIALDHSVTSCGISINPAGTATPGGPFCFEHDFDGSHTAKVGLNYRFGGWGGLCVPKIGFG
jgi:outer membrane immunogenic protein